MKLCNIVNNFTVNDKINRQTAHNFHYICYVREIKGQNLTC